MRVKVDVPKEANVGDKLQFQSPTGHTCEIVVPKGLSRGMFTGKRVILVLRFQYLNGADIASCL